MLGSDDMRLIVEVDEIAGSNVHGPHAEAHLARIDAVEVDQTFEGRAQACRVVETGGLERSRRMPPGHWHSRLKEAGCTDHESGRRAELIEPTATELPSHPGHGLELCDLIERRRRSNALPKFPQPRNSLFRGVARDEGGVDGADGDSGNPVRVQLRFAERFVDARLVSAQRAAALQQQCDALEGQLPVKTRLRRAAQGTRSHPEPRPSGGDGRLTRGTLERFHRGSTLCGKLYGTVYLRVGVVVKKNVLSGTAAMHRANGCQSSSDFQPERRSP